MKTYLILNRMESALVYLVEVLVDVLVRQVTCDEDTICETVCTREFRQRARNLPRLEVLQKSCKISVCVCKFAILHWTHLED